MGKKRKRAAGPRTDTTESSASALILDNNLYDRSGNPTQRNKVVDGCRVVFEKILDRPAYGLAFRPQLVAGGVVAYHLSGPDAVRAEAGDRPYRVLPLDDAPRFWVTCALRFRPELMKARLVEVSIVFFRGGATDPKQPILRAEWDCISDRSNTDHAQPHWHVYQESVTPPEVSTANPVELETLQTLDDVTEPRAHRSSTEIGGANFHLAMASRWDLGGSHRIPLTVEGVTGWVEGCVRYTRGQLTQS